MDAVYTSTIYLSQVQNFLATLSDLKKIIHNGGDFFYEHSMKISSLSLPESVIFHEPFGSFRSHIVSFRSLSNLSNMVIFRS